ncbi:MAG: hypothetical protein ACTSRS_19465 [Candidatus Helarchaeota archaeon]
MRRATFSPLRKLPERYRPRGESMRSLSRKVDAWLVQDCLAFE